MKTNVEEVVRTCYECRGASLGKRENYNYSECGLKYVVLKGVFVYRCTRCGSARVEIPNMDGLHRTIALIILEKGSALSSDEIRFLRTVAGFTATGFANALGVTKQALSRWENNQKIGPHSERSIRITCGLSIIEEIANDKMNTGDVNLENVQKTLEKIKKHLLFVAPRKSVKNGAAGGSSDSAQLLIDPEFPFSSSMMDRLPSGVPLEQIVQ